MRELDFDELDRAVNTLMSSAPVSTPPPSVDDDTRVITIPSTIDSSSTPVMPRFTSPTSRPGVVTGLATDAITAELQPAVPVAERPIEPVTEPVSRLTIPSRRAGRFMDVVHPSSDMKNPSNAPLTQPSRTAVSIEPLAASGVDEQPAANIEEFVEQVDTFASIAEPDTVAEPYVAADTVTEPSVAMDRVDTTSDWPDPLASFSATEPDTATATVATVEAVSNATVLLDGDEVGDDDLFTIDTTEPDDPEPLVSPFLTDAKVEKRPLGTASDEPGRAPVLGTLADQTLTQSDPDDQLPADPVERIVQPLPAELQDDLIAVESDNSSFAASEEPVAEATAPVDVVNEVPTAQQSAAAAGPTSIQQQYKESAATGDQTNGSIYDTQAYHQPLAHPLKKKSGWLWVIWVVLLLVVGAGGAVALYYFGLI